MKPTQPDLPLAYESLFERALREEEKWLCVVVEQPMPDDELAGRRVYVGPCLPSISGLHYL